ncbi:glutathione S-transferase [Cenococcum geophilum]
MLIPLSILRPGNILFKYIIYRHPLIANNRITLYVKKASLTLTANTVKPLILLKALLIPHSIHIINSTINLYKMVPALEDITIINSGTSPYKEPINMFNSLAYLLYLANKYNKEGLFRGRGLRERASLILKPKNVGDAAISVFIRYITLPTRPTIADIAILPLINKKVTVTAEISFNNYPTLKG